MHDRFSSNFPPRKVARAGSVQPAARVFPLWPERWHVVFDEGEHPLWISPGAAPFYKRCLSHLISDPATTLRTRALLQLHRVFPRAGILTEIRLPRALRRMLSFEFALRGLWRAAIRIGPAGPRQKASVVIATDSGEDIAFAGVAMTPGADSRISAEVESLRRLAVVPHLAGRVPRLLADGITLAGRRYFITTLAPGARRSGALTPGHLRFLSMLAQLRPEAYTFGVSPCLRRIELMLARLQLRIDRDTRVGLWEATRDCAIQLSGWRGPFVTAHGDFTARNICVGRDEIFVCDWEKARSGANPLADILSFLWSVRPDALSRASAFSAAIGAVGERIRRVHPACTWPYAVVAALALAWLIETMLQYCMENECFDAGDAVVRTHSRLIEARSMWLVPF
ncbi:MAG: phosphotransferase [Betaproteobacteria bacterium]